MSNAVKAVVRLCGCWVLAGLCALPVNAATELIERKRSNDVVATAAWMPGEAAKPVVLLVHGFLQTREFSTVENLARALNEEGYGVLRPTLTLNLTHRKQSMACDAIHTHTMASDLAELREWVGWLKANTSERLVLMGHSYGSFQLLRLMSSWSDERVDHLVMGSLVDPGVEGFGRQVDIDQARRMSAADDRRLVRFPMAYCKPYVGTPDSYLSYANINTASVLHDLSQLGIDHSVIVGSKDVRAPKAWIEKLNGLDLNLVLIPGANHFFAGEHEFDLLQAMVDLLESLNKS